MISYNKLFETLDEKGISLIELERGIGISSSTTAKFRKGQAVQLGILVKICYFLDVPIEKVIEIKK